MSTTGARTGVLDSSEPSADALLGRVAELLVERAGPHRGVRLGAAGAGELALVQGRVVA